MYLFLLDWLACIYFCWTGWHIFISAGLIGIISAGLVGRQVSSKDSQGLVSTGNPAVTIGKPTCFHL